MIAGDTFLRAGRHVKTDPHLWIVISDPAKDRAYLVAANVTSQRIDKDQSCVEHDFISRESVVLYSGARIVPESAILSAQNAGLLKFHKRVGALLLERIRAGAARTSHLPLAAKRILQTQKIIPWDS